LDYWLGEISVGEVDKYHVKVNPKCRGMLGWFFVATDQGVTSYFVHEKDAFRFRLAEINRRLNG
jgi:hypothetical protein